MKTKTLRILVFFVMLLAGYSSAFAQQDPCPGAVGPPVGCCPCTGCAPTIVAPSICAHADTIVVPITVQGGNFYDIAAISLELGFDPGILTYVPKPLIAPNLPAGAPQPVVTTPVPGAGAIRISWTWINSSNLGWTLNNNDVLFNLTFANHPSSSVGYVSPLTWTVGIGEFANVTQVHALDRQILCQTASNYVNGWIATQKVTVSADTTKVCAKGVVHLTGTNTPTLGPYTKLWTTDAPAGWLSSTNTCCPTFTPQLPGTYHLTYKVTDAYGCSDSKTIIIIVYSLPTATITGTTQVCKGTTPLPVITMCGANGTTPYTFTYNINGGTNMTVTTTGTNTCATVPVATTPAGVYAYNLVSVSDANNCSQPASGTATVTVWELPTATVSGGGSVCKNGTPAPKVTFCGANGLPPYSFTYKINGGTPIIVSTTGTNTCVDVTAPVNAAGVFVYTLQSVSDSHQCSQPASGTATVTIWELPNGAITGGGSVCKNGTPAPKVTFCGTSGAVPYTFGYKINGGTTLFVSTTGTNTCVDVTAPVTAAGVFVYTLQSVSDNHQCSQPASGTATVTIWELPTATITGGGAVCKNGTPAPKVTFCGANGAIPYSFTYSVNGGTPITVTTTGTNTCIDVTAPVGTAGVFVYTLSSVSDNHQCSQPASGTATVTIWELPTATITGGGSVCKNGTPAPKVTFCGANGAIPYTFTYKINGGSPITVSTTGTNTCVDVTAPVTAAGVFVYTLQSVSDTHLCSQPASGTATVTIWELPTATITGGGAVCKNGTPAPKVTFCGANGAIPYTFTYSINGGTATTVTTTGTNTCVDVTAPVNAAGVFVYTLSSVSDVHLCSQPASGTATVTIWELPNGAITGGGSVCKNGTPAPKVTFCGTSGAVPYTFGYKINGGTTLFVSTTGTNTCVDVTAPVTAAGVFVYTLQSVSDVHQCSQPASGTATVTIWELPTATITGGGAVCKNGTPAPKVTFCGANGAIPYSFTYSVNGGTPITVTTTGTNTCIDVTAPVGTAGVFVYTLSSVSDNHQCSQPASGTATVTIWELPTAVVTGNVEVCVGSEPAPKVTFCGANGLAPYTFTYNINGGTNTTVITTGTNTCIDVVAPTGVVGSFVYNLVSVSDSHQCSQPATGTATVIVHPLPPCGITGDKYVCFNNPCTVYEGPLEVTKTVSVGLTYFWTVAGNGTIVGSNTGRTVCVSTGDQTAGASFILTLKTCRAYANGQISCCTVCYDTVYVTYRKITGHLKYPNCVDYTLQTPMNNVTVGLVLLPGTTPIQTTVTDANGYYQFNDLCPGFYTIVVLQNNKVVNGDGINSTDAAQVNYWPTVVPYAISHARFLSGDVSNDNAIAANDALLIQGYFVNGQYKPSPPAPPNTLYFTRSPWSYWVRGETVDNNVPAPSLTWSKQLKSIADIVVDMEGIVTGDFNESFTPGNAKSASSSLNLNNGETKRVVANQEFELPIQVTSAMEIGAISLILDIPSDLIEVKDVVLNGSNVPVAFKVNGNELRIGWNSLTPPINITAGGELIVLKLKATANFTEGKTFQIALASSPLNELADGTAEVIQNVTLNAATVSNSALGVDNLQSQALNMNVYPNPFSDFTTVSYTLPVDGTVTLEIQTLLGQVMTTLVNEPQTSGHHTLKVDARTMSQGVYTAILRLHNNNNEMVRTIKFVVNK